MYASEKTHKNVDLSWCFDVFADLHWIIHL